jgi:hypothetical protein
VNVALSLPRKIAEKVLALLDAGRTTGAAAVPAKEPFTTTEAATMPGLSRPALTELITSGEICIAGFPPAALPASIARHSLDDFLLDLLDLHPGQVVTAVRAIAGRTGKSGPRMTASEIAAYLSTHGTPLPGERLPAAPGTAP